jgi:hypothetical protein
MEKNRAGGNSVTTLVSAIYGHGISSLYGGRGRDIRFYNSSLKNIANLGLPLVIYADERDIPTIDYFLSGYHKNYKLIPSSLDEFEFSQQFLDYKSTILNQIDINDRNEILCYSKAYWVKDAIEKNFFDTENFLWIDSGLTHHGIIPEKVGGVELFVDIPSSQYYPENTNNIFTPTLGQKLSNTIKDDKLFFCALPWAGSSELIRSTIAEYSGKADLPYICEHLIGGIFGGKKEKFLEFFTVYRDVLRYFIEHKIHVLEEPIFSGLYSLLPNMFDIRRFYTWYFYSPGERTHVLEQEGDSFYKVFTKILEE